MLFSPWLVSFGANVTHSTRDRILCGCLLSDFKPSRAKRRVSSDIVRVVSQSDEISTTTIPTEPWTVLAHKKPQKDWIAYNPKTMRPQPLTRDTKFVKLLSWNVNGLRALLKLEGFSALELAQREDFDVLCLQETKLQVEYWCLFKPFRIVFSHSPQF